MRLLRSVASKLILLTIIFIGVPVLVYQQFQAADEEKTELLMRAIREQGKALALALEPSLKKLTPKTFNDITKRLEELSSSKVNIKIMLWPGPLSGKADFYYIASLPALPKDYRDLELADLRESGIFNKLDESCVTDSSLTHRYINPAGKDELLTSVIPVRSAAGCWLVITSNLASDFGGTEIGRPYWMRFQVQFSLAIYFGMAAIVLALLLEVRRNLLHFTRLARDIRRRGGGGESFRSANNIPELDGVAVEFDGMVRSLTTSADAIRSTAEETAHALKTPIGVLAQAIEPLKRSLEEDDERGRKSIERIELAIERLGTIVDRNRRLEEITAETLNPKQDHLDLKRIVSEVVEERRRSLSADDPSIDFDTTSRDIHIRGNKSLVQSAVDNLIENAVSFSEQGGRVTVGVHKNGSNGVITVEDEGPGANEADLERIFDRNFSRRTNGSTNEHFGLGLWIVRRNISALGGNVCAQNISPSGLRVVIELPLEP